MFEDYIYAQVYIPKFLCGFQLSYYVWLRTGLVKLLFFVSVE